MKDLLQGTKEERARFTYQCIQGIVCNSDSNPIDVLEDITKIIELYQRTKDYTMDNTVYTLSVQKIRDMLPFEYGDLCMYINPFEVQDWDTVNVVNEFVPVCDRDQDYDLGRIKYFLEHSDEIDCIDLEYDGDILTINDGNHRFMAACLLGYTKINATFCGVLNYPDDISVVDSLKFKVGEEYE